MIVYKVKCSLAIRRVNKIVEMNEENRFLIVNNVESLFAHCYFYASYIVRRSALPPLLAEIRKPLSTL